MKRSRSHVDNVAAASSSEGRETNGSALRAHSSKDGGKGQEVKSSQRRIEFSVDEEDVPPTKTRSMKDLGRQRDGADQNGDTKPQLYRAGSHKRQRSEREDRAKVRSIIELSSREKDGKIRNPGSRRSPSKSTVSDDDGAAAKSKREVKKGRVESEKSEMEEGELIPEVDSAMEDTGLRMDRIDGEGSREKNMINGELTSTSAEGVVVSEGGDRELKKVVVAESEPAVLPQTRPELEEKEVKAENHGMETVHVNWRTTRETDEVPEDRRPQRTDVLATLGARVDLQPSTFATPKAEGGEGGISSTPRDAIKGQELTLALGGPGQLALMRETATQAPSTENFLDRAGLGNGGGDETPSDRVRKSWERRISVERNADMAKDLLDDMQKQKRPKLQVPLVSKSLPDTSLSLGSSDPSLAAGDHDRSVHSRGAARTFSTGYTNSLSLSHSHFMHNPSCSLTQNSFENQEVSCGSHQISQGNDQASYGSWRLSEGREPESSGFVAVSRRSKPRRELPLYQQMLQNGNPQILQGSLGNDRTRDRGARGRDSDLEGSYQLPHVILPIQRNLDGQVHMSVGDSPDKPRLLHREGSERHLEAWSSPSRSGNPPDTRSEQQSWLQEASVGARSMPERSPEHDWRLTERVSSDQSGPIGLHELVTDPIPVMARKLQVLPNSYLNGLKDSLREMLGSIEKREEFVALQKTLQRRKNLTTEVLLRAHPTQLELLVAVKTGILAFLHPQIPVTHSALVEIFLQTKCRNMACQNTLPSDDCECPICSAKTGFCNACMCVVCSKFDFDANTCRWIGCDFCLHWCHTDCGIRMGYIAPGASEMQFRCIACEHTSELFGFVKEVFTACAKVWNKDVLSKELDCVRRIFHGSEDLKGKQLCRKAEQMLLQLDSQADSAEVCRSMVRFFTGELGL